MADSKSIVPDWGSPSQVWQSTEVMQKVEYARAINRSLIDNLANGGKPFTPDEQKKFGIMVNVNFLQLTRKLQDAIGQVNNAFIPNGNYFTARCTASKQTLFKIFSRALSEDKKSEYGQKFTKNINEVLKTGESGKRHLFIMRSRNASVALHGIGPLMWTNDYRLFPRYVPLEDLLIPTDTLIDFSNLPHFAVNLYLTPGELYRMALMGPDDSGWNKKAVVKILEFIRDDKWAPYWPANNTLWYQRPEAVQELWKQNSGYLQSDSVSKARLRAFYYQNPKAENGEQKWYRVIIQRDPYTATEPQEFLYEGKGPFAETLSDIIHCQFGDNSLVPPLKYHSVRGIGMMLYGACEVLNRMQCQGMQHVFQNLQSWFRIANPTDTDRAKLVNLMQNGVLNEGVSVVPQDERHQIDANLWESALGLLNQNIAQGSSSFTQQPDTSNKEMTAREAMIRLNQANAMVGNVLSLMYAQEISYYEQLVRRALRKNSADPWAQKFQEACKADGIPDELMKPEHWKIIAERVLGAGDNVLAQAISDALIEKLPLFDPDSQRIIKHKWVATVTDDPDFADVIVPPEQDPSTSGTKVAENIYGTLMRGIQIPVRQGIDMVGYAGALLDMLQTEVQRILQVDGMPNPEDLIGYLTVASHVEQVLQVIAQDEQQKPVVKQLNDLLGKLMNELKGFAQRLQEQQGEQMDGPMLEAQAKANATTMLAETKARISEMTAQQKAQHKEQQFSAKMQQSMEAHATKLKQQMESHLQQLIQQHEKAQADIQAKGMQTGADVAATTLTATAKAEAAAKSAEKKNSEKS